MSKDELIAKLYKDIQDKIVTKDFCSIANTPDYVTNYFAFEEKDNILSIKIKSCKLADEPESERLLSPIFHIDDDAIDFVDTSIIVPEIAKSVDDIILRKIWHIDPTYLWSSRVPPLEEASEYCKSFLDVLEMQCQRTYMKNRRYFPNVLLIDPKVLPILELTGKLTRDHRNEIDCCSKVGTLKVGNSINLDVYVAPQLTSGEYALVTGMPNKLATPYTLNYTLDLDVTNGVTISGFKYHFKDLMSTDLVAKGKVVD